VGRSLFTEQGNKGKRVKVAAALFSGVGANYRVQILYDLQNLNPLSKSDYNGEIIAGYFAVMPPASKIVSLCQSNVRLIPSLGPTSALKPIKPVSLVMSGHRLAGEPAVAG